MNKSIRGQLRDWLAKSKWLSKGAAKGIKPPKPKDLDNLIDQAGYHSAMRHFHFPSKLAIKHADLAHTHEKKVYSEGKKQGLTKDHLDDKLTEAHNHHYGHISQKHDEDPYENDSHIR